MCSFIFTNTNIGDLKFVNQLTRLRGPDHTSQVHNGAFTFIHNLLSITGAFTPQPTVSADNQIFCLFNGEIYNYRELGDFCNDSRCLIPLYEAHGPDFIRHLDGEFSIVLADFKTSLLVFTTDVFGTKPLWLAREGRFVGAATYRSPLQRLGFNHIQKLAANTSLLMDLNTLEIRDRKKVFEFDVSNQEKTDFDDWTRAFAHAIRKRAVTNVREKIFIGLSSGYDSGAIACELNRQKVPFKAYSILGNENRAVLAARNARLNGTGTVEPLSINEAQRRAAHDFIVENTEPFKYRTYSSSSDYNEFNLSLQDDHGANSLSFVCSRAASEGRKIYLSGQGADEIFSDYGFNGHKIYPHSNFGGLFPEDLRSIFPWPSFYESSQLSYLTKEEYVAGAYGLEARYPYLDPTVVQEFLWLDHRLKNKWYKSVLHNYLAQKNFPFAPNQKIGF
jgi:asparagine synthetase B (glutamine-hydrolysing)